MKNGLALFLFAALATPTASAVAGAIGFVLCFLIAIVWLIAWLIVKKSGMGWNPTVEEVHAAHVKERAAATKKPANVIQFQEDPFANRFPD